MNPHTRKLIEEYLDSRHSTLWGQYFDLSQSTSREAAAVFIEDLLRDLGPRRLVQMMPRASFDVV